MIVMRTKTTAIRAIRIIIKNDNDANNARRTHGGHDLHEATPRCATRTGG
jgi:hypothetical protein